MIVVARVLFRVLFGGGDFGTVLVDLPEIPLPDWALGVHLLGPLTRESLLFAVYDGLRLGTIVLCVGAANSLANPKRLLRSMPAALLRDRHRPRGRRLGAAPAGRQPAAGARRAAAARRRRPAARAAAPPARPGARGRARTLARAGRRHGHPRVRPRGRPHRRPAPAHRRADAGRPLRPVRRHVRRARPHRTPRPGAADGRPGRGRGVPRAGGCRRPGRAHPLPPRPLAAARVAGAGQRRRRRHPGGRRQPRGAAGGVPAPRRLAGPLRDPPRRRGHRAGRRPGRAGAGASRPAHPRRCPQ